MTKKSAPFGASWVCRGTAAFAVFTAASTMAGAALGQSSIDGEITVQRFSPAPGPRNFITTRSARSDGEMTWTAGFMANYAFEPLSINSCRIDRAAGELTCDDVDQVIVQQVKIVENLVTGDFIGTLTPIPQVQLALRVPITYAKGQGIDPNTLISPENAGDRIDQVGLGDAEFEAKGRFYGGSEQPLTFGAAVYATAPLGHLTAEHTYIGDQSPTVGGRLIVDGVQGPVTWGVNLGGVWREAAQIGLTTLGSEARFSAAAGYQVGPLVRVVGDVFGSTNFSGDSGTTAVELDGALQFTPIGIPIAVTAGAGAGLTQHAIGAPTVRVFVGLLYVNEVRDRDGDGINDAEDQCPTDPEDRDGHEDSDGCPDDDMDGDGIPDDLDKCPQEAEDLDGFEDSDGCPDPDNDGDGVPDEMDRCPEARETMNGFQDDDGCPDDVDTDRDGIPDQDDQCPTEPEDTDGHDDTDGCPDPDNDGDGIPDIQDECVDEPETKNGFEDEDGCPDEAP